MMNRCLWCKEQLMMSLSFSDLLFFGNRQEALCQFCRLQLDDLLEKKRCRGCGRGQKSASFCQDCTNWKKLYPDYSFDHTALYSYNDFAKNYMEKYKIIGDCELSAIFSDDMNRWIKTKGKDFLVVPIPISKKSQLIRGFNQTELLLEKAKIPFSRLLENKSEQSKQSKKNKQERMQLTQPFKVKDKEQIKGSKILLVDDIYTTGRTLFHAAEVIQRHQPIEIQTFSLFR